MTSIREPAVMPRRTATSDRRCACGHYQLPGRRDFVYAHPDGRRSDQHGRLSCDQIRLGEEQPLQNTTVKRERLKRDRRGRTLLVTEEVEASFQPPRRIDFRRLDQ